MNSLPFKVSHTSNYKGFERDSYSVLVARIDADINKAVLSISKVFWVQTMLAIRQGAIRYAEMFGFTYLIIMDIPAYALVNQVGGMLRYAFPEEMAEEDAWSELE